MVVKQMHHNNKGFVMLETIIVLSVLCIILISLYGGYVSLIKNAKSTMYYDNTEYLYKTYILGKYLQKNVIGEGSYACANCTQPYTYCKTKSHPCESIEAPYYIESLIKSMRVKAIYITKWDTSYLNEQPELMNLFEASVQRYIKQLNPVKKEDGKHRIIIMYEDEIRCKSNAYGACETHQFASVEFNSEIKSISFDDVTTT